MLKRPAMLPAILIFAVTYVVIAIGKLPGYRLDRAGAALLGASLMVGVGVLSLGEAYRAIDLETITLVNLRSPGQDLASVPPALRADVGRSLRLGIAIATILGEVHAARVFHGDLNPGNVVYEIATEATALINFGEAVVQSHADQEFVHPSMLGRALPFSAPEQTGRMNRSIDSRIVRLRRKLDTDTIVTIRGTGYRFDPPAGWPD